MYVENKKMYHIHRMVCGYNEIWHENNEIIVSQNFNNSLYLNTLSHYFGIENEGKPMDFLCSDILCFRNKLEEKSKEEIYDFLMQIYCTIHNIGFREEKCFWKNIEDFTIHHFQVDGIAYIFVKKNN